MNDAARSAAKARDARRSVAGNASTAPSKPQGPYPTKRGMLPPAHPQLFRPVSKRRPDSHRSVFSLWLRIRNHQSGTPCRHAFGIARAKRHAGMLSRVPERNAMPACIRICRSRTERPQARQNRLRREATRWPAGWERRTRERHFHGQDRRAPWHRCRTASCATPASRRCPLPPAAPR